MDLLLERGEEGLHKDSFSAKKKRIFRNRPPADPGTGQFSRILSRCWGKKNKGKVRRGKEGRIVFLGGKNATIGRRRKKNGAKGRSLNSILRRKLCREEI